MESNRDEAEKCIRIARKHLDSGNISSARKFCQKSIALFETGEALKLLAVINAAGDDQPAASTSSATEEHPSAAGVKHRNTQAQGSTTPNGSANGNAGPSEKKKSFTPEQHAVVKRVRACKVTAYYEILSLETSCEENDIKKAYRKLALALHPDKNGAPGADEAFKLVSKAFQVLSDPQKRAIYDQSGADPEDRYGGRTSSPSAGFSSFNGGGPMFESEISPEDLFNMFFGGGMGGMGGTTFATSGFGGPGISFSFGPGGFTSMNGMGRRGAQQYRQQNAAPAEPRSVLIQLLPLLLLFAFSLLSALPSLFSTPPVPDPRFSFQGSARFNVQRTTHGLGVEYHVNKGEFVSHPVIGAELAKQDGGSSSSDKAATKQRGPGLMQFENNVDRAYTQEKYAECQRGTDRKQRDRDQEIGLLGIGTDWEKVKKIDERQIEACEILKKLNIIR